MNALRDANDPLRTQLRELGYLENPLTRFFAGGLGGRHPAFRTHVRVGLGVGIALGSAAALLTAPVLIASPAPIPAWLALAAVGLSFVVSLAVGLLTAAGMFLAYRTTRRLVDRAELVARSTAIAVFVLVFVYLLSFWRRYGAAVAEAAGFGGAAGIEDALAAVVVVLLALAAARLFHLASYAVLAAIPGYGFAPRRRGARRALVAGAIVAAAAAFAVSRATPRDVVPAFAERPDPIEMFSPLRPLAPLAPRVLLVAIDGLGGANAEAAMSRGWMPNLASLCDQAYVAPLGEGTTETEKRIPPAFWTTVTTGLDVHRHHIDAYYKDRVLGLSQALAGVAPPGLVDTAIALGRVLGLAEEVPVIGSTSRVKRVGDVAAEAGLRTASINFWATYPASAFPGTTISDRAYRDMMEAQVSGSARDPEAAPAAEVERLRPFLHGDEVAVERVPEVALHGLGKNHATTMPLLYDFFVEDAALELLRRSDAPAYLQIGLTGLDVLRYAYLVREPARTDARLAAQSDILRGAYGALDVFLGELRSAAGDDAILVIATFPGISAAGPDERGILVVHGDRVNAGKSTEEVRPESLAPLLLWMLGLPASEEQDGRADEGVFRDELGSHPSRPRMARAFGLKPELEIPDGSSEAALRFLKELGYLGSE